VPQGRAALELASRGENGSGTRFGYRIRILIRDAFSDTNTGIFKFGTDTDTTRMRCLRIQDGYRMPITRQIPGTCGRIRVPGARVPGTILAQYSTSPSVSSTSSRPKFQIESCIQPRAKATACQPLSRSAPASKRQAAKALRHSHGKQQRHSRCTGDALALHLGIDAPPPCL
jgi:hypothetical protein